MNTALKQTPLYDFHREHNAKMVPFAGYQMPLHYPSGIIAEHIHTRQSAVLFDVSHMGQIRITGRNAAAALETLVPSDIAGLETNRMRYSILTCGTGGIIDDLIVTKRETDLFLVVNAALKDMSIAHLQTHLPEGVTVEVMADHAIMALQGPDAVTVLASLAPGVENLAFMTGMWTEIAGTACYVTRSGYTGEDGFEISVPADKAAPIAARLASDPAVMPGGLGARDSLRMEAGYGLSGQDFDETTTPVEAGLGWLIGKRRREAADFLGAGPILAELDVGPQWVRAGIKPLGRTMARPGTPLRDLADGRAIGVITSAGFAPSVGGPVALGYIEPEYTEPGTSLILEVREKELDGEVASFPFVPHKYKRPSGSKGKKGGDRRERVTIQQRS